MEPMALIVNMVACSQDFYDDTARLVEQTVDGYEAWLDVVRGGYAAALVTKAGEVLAQNGLGIKDIQRDNTRTVPINEAVSIKVLGREKTQAV